MIHLRAHVEHVDHHRRDRHHALVGRRREPRGPASLGGARNGELLQRCAPAFARDRLHRVHRTDRALHHRQQQRPIAVAALQILLEGVGDQRVFATIKNRCERHLAQHGDGGADLVCKLRKQCGFPRQLRLGARAVVFGFPATAVNEQQRLFDIRLHVGGTNDKKLMLPVDVAPGLRGEQVLDVLRITHASRGDFPPAELLIRARDIRRQLARGAGREPLGLSVSPRRKQRDE